MAKFVVQLVYGDQELLQQVRPVHREYCKELAERGVLLAAGPYADGEGAQLVYEAASEEELEKILDRDPYTERGVVAERAVREWTPVLGTWL